MLTRLVAALAAASIVGCTVAPKKSDYDLYVQASTTSRPQTKMFEFKCPATGCNFTEFVAYTPSDTGKELQPPPKQDHPAVEFGKFFVGTLKDLAMVGMPWYFGAKVLTKAFDKADSSITNTTTTTNTDSSNRSTNNTTNTTTTTTNTTEITNSQNTNRNCTSGTVTGTTTPTSGPATC